MLRASFSHLEDTMEIEWSELSHKIEGFLLFGMVLFIRRR